LCNENLGNKVTIFCFILWPWQKEMDAEMFLLSFFNGSLQGIGYLCCSKKFTG
jgi:hypothetical protein